MKTFMQTIRDRGGTLSLFYKTTHREANVQTFCQTFLKRHKTVKDALPQSAKQKKSL
jgi:hypothetical protein